MHGGGEEHLLYDHPQGPSTSQSGFPTFSESSLIQHHLMETRPLDPGATQTFAPLLSVPIHAFLASRGYGLDLVGDL